MHGTTDAEQLNDGTLTRPTVPPITRQPRVAVKRWTLADQAATQTGEDSMSAPQTRTRRKTKLVDRLAMGEFVNGYAPVMLDGEPVGELHRTPGWIWSTVLGEPYGGGKNYKNALKAVAVGYQKITGNWEA